MGKYSKLFPIIKKAVFAGGEILLENLGKLSDTDINEKGKNDFVTKVDKQSEDCIVKILKKQTPDYDILTEETPQEDMKKEFRWIVDPLDGTTNYIHNFPFFAISIALEEKDTIMLVITAARDSGIHTKAENVAVESVRCLFARGYGAQT